jgi:hypothetical protein
MAVMCLLLLASNGCLLCLFGVTLSVLSYVRPDVLGRCSKQTTLPPSEGEGEEEEEIRCSAQSEVDSSSRRRGDPVA